LADPFLLTAQPWQPALTTRRYALATSIEGLRREVRAGRAGKEAFSILVATLVSAGEHMVVNRSDDREQYAGWSGCARRTPKHLLRRK
jgi:hypothetical protein